LNAKANSGLGSRFERLPGSWPGAWAEKTKAAAGYLPSASAAEAAGAVMA